MVQVVTREWEIAKMYISEVVSREGRITLEWSDFEMSANLGKPAVAVIVDEPLDVSVLVARAFEEVNKNLRSALSSLIVVVSYKKEQSLMMDEMQRVYAGLSDIVDEGVDFMWGTQDVEDMANDRRIMVFAFEKQKDE